jgi:hypothetical protein
MLSVEASNINFIVFGLTTPAIKGILKFVLTYIFSTRDEGGFSSI